MRAGRVCVVVQSGAALFLSAVMMIASSPSAANAAAGCAGGGTATLATGTAIRPWSLAVDGAGKVYIAERDAHRVRVLYSSKGKNYLKAVAGRDGVQGFSGDGRSSVTARVNFPHGLSMSTAGNLLIADFGNRRIRKVTAGCTISTVAGGGTPPDNYGVGIPAVQAMLYTPIGVSIDTAGSFYIAESNNDDIRMVDANGIITTVVGAWNKYGPLGDGGPAYDARIDIPMDVETIGLNYYIADKDNLRVRKVENGIINTYAGGTTAGAGGDGGPANQAQLHFVYGLGADSQGNLYIADVYAHIVRKVDANGVITKVAGTAYVSGYGGDGGLAVDATLNAPTDVAVDAAGNVYIADRDNNVVRRVDAATRIITTVAGNGQ